VRGVLVFDIIQGGPADLGGLHASTEDSLEIITAINGEPILGFPSLIAYLATHTRPGDVVTLTVLRDGETISVDVELGTRPAR
jgi:S1-C subfamily serine protease